MIAWAGERNAGSTLQSPAGSINTKGRNANTCHANAMQLRYLTNNKNRAEIAMMLCHELRKPIANKWRGHPACAGRNKQLNQKYCDETE